jgi:hypothetical protein
MQGISATGGVNATLNTQISAKQIAAEGTPAEETKETAAQKAAEAAKNVETVNAPKAAPEGVGKGVNLLA